MGAMNNDLADPWDRFLGNVDRELRNATVFVPKSLDWAISRYLGECRESP